MSGDARAALDAERAHNSTTFTEYRKRTLTPISDITFPPGTVYQTPEGLRAEDEETRAAFDVQGGIYPIRESVFRATYELPADALPFEETRALRPVLDDYHRHFALNDSRDCGACTAILARLPVPVDAERLDGAAMIARERRRQIVEEGYDEDHDRYGTGELSRAAACYALGERGLVPADWPWDAQFWKPTPNDRVRELTKAGALVAAAIDVLLAEARDDAALAPAPSEPRHEPGDPHQYRITCEVCGERGTIRLTVDPETALTPAPSDQDR